MKEGPWVFNIWPNKEMTIKYRMYGNNLGTFNTLPS